MAISFVSSGSTTIASSGSISPRLPPGWQANDIFVCTIASLDNVPSSMPSGWIAIDPGTNNGNKFRTTTFYKIATFNEIDPTVTHSGGRQIEATIVAYRYVDITNPLDRVGSIAVNGSSTTVTASAITTTTVNDLVVFIGSIASRSTFSSYSGSPVPIERIDTPNNTGYPSTFLADFPIVGVGSTGNRTATATSAGVSNSQLFALKLGSGTLTFITDPPGAGVYIDGVLQTSDTSMSVLVDAGSHNVTFSKPGFQSYTTTAISQVNQTINISAVLMQIASLTSYGIVICSGSGVSTCPITPLVCPISADSSNYINFVAVFNSTAPVSLTVNFSYTLDGMTYIASVPVNLVVGMNAVYAFPNNIQYSPNTVISLTDVTLS